MARYFTLPATEELVELYADDVLRVCNYYLGKRSLAEDAFQDVFVKVIRKRDTFAGDCPPKYWLMSIAKNVCKDYLKSAWATRIGSFEQMNEEYGEKDDMGSSKSVGVSASVDGRETEDMYFDSLDPEGELWDAINALPDAYKDVILFRYYGVLDNCEIARILGITESTVRSRIFRAKKMLSRFEKRRERASEALYERSI